MFLKLILDQGALLLDDENFLHAFRETANALPFERPAHRDLVNAKPDFRRVGLVDSQILKGLPDVEVGFSGGDDAQPRVRAADGDAVELVGSRERQGRVDLVFVEPLLLGQRRIRPTDVQSVRRDLEVVGRDDRHAARVDGYRCRAFHGCRYGLEGNPNAGKMGHGPAK